MSKVQQPTGGRDGRHSIDTTVLMERYCAEHPRSPSAIRRPQLFLRNGTFVALLGRNFQNGIAGLGNTVEGALRAFDLQYLRALRPPAER